MAFDSDIFKRMGEGADRWRQMGNTVAHLFGPQALQGHDWKKLTPVMDDLLGMMPDEILNPETTQISIKNPGSAGAITMGEMNPLFQQGGILQQRGIGIDQLVELLGL